MRHGGVFSSLVLAAAASVTSAHAAPSDVLMQHNDLARTGATLVEDRLTTSNVRPGSFGKLYTRPVDGAMYAQPLVVHGVGAHDVVYLATMHNGVYAYDLDPTVTAPLWQRRLEPSLALPDVNIGSACGVYRDISGEVGIISTPVVDPARGVLYLVTATRSGSGASVSYAHWIHALDLATGEERLGGPRRIEASISAGGSGSDGGALPFQSRYENQRASLLLTSDTVYVGFGGYCDSGPFHGWLLGYGASDLVLGPVWNTTPEGSEGGIWQAGQGPSVDDDGNLYVVTGNGTSTHQNSGTDLGSAVVKLAPDLTVLDWFIPHDFASLSGMDDDLGSTGALLVPDTTLAVVAAKSGKAYVLDRAALGHYNAAGDSQIVQSFGVTSGGRIYGSPVFWKGPSGPLVYLQAEYDPLKAFRVVSGGLASPPVAKGLPSLATGMPGGVLSVSSNGAAPGTGIVWANVSLGPNANQQVVGAALRAYDAEDVSTEIWDSTMDAEHDAPGLLAKFAPPTIADGRVYLGTFSGELAVYGLRSAEAGAPDAATPDAASPDAATPDAASPDDAGAIPAEAGAELEWLSVGGGCGIGGAGAASGYFLVGALLVTTALRRRRARDAKRGVHDSCGGRAETVDVKQGRARPDERFPT